MARQKKNIQDETARRTIEGYLRYRERATQATDAGGHLDEDKLSAFVEGSLSQAESAPLLSHLVSCSFCRRATTQLIRLESETGDAEIARTPQTPEPGRVRRLLESLAARVLPQSDEEAVFAYHAPAEDLQQQQAEATREGREQEEDAGEGGDPASPQKHD